MTDDRRPLFTSFDDAWRWFADGGQLTPMAEWRQRFTAGRGQLLSFQVPIGETAIADAVDDLQSELDDVDGLAMLEPEMLHISVRGVGFQVIAKTRPDDVSREEVGRISQQAASIVRATKPIDIDVGPVNVSADALILEVHDRGALAELRRRLSPAVDDAFGLPDSPYLPHVTVAMFADTSAAAALRERLTTLRERAPATATIKRVELARWWFTGSDTDFPERDALRTYPLRG